jgi:chorismate-pyruvate lyase
MIDIFQISSDVKEQLTDELRHHIDETDLAMNELSELLVSSTTDTISAQPMKLAEQLMDNASVESELERRHAVLQQLNANVQTLKQLLVDHDDTESIEGRLEKSSNTTARYLIISKMVRFCLYFHSIG